jgi:hypothetical protein
MRTVRGGALPWHFGRTLERVSRNFSPRPPFARSAEYPLEHQVRHERGGHDCVMSDRIAMIRRIIEVSFEERTPFLHDKHDSVSGNIAGPCAAARHYGARGVSINDEDA